MWQIRYFICSIYSYIYTESVDTRAVQKLKFSIKDFFSDCKPLRRIRSFFWTVFFRIRTEYEEIVRITLYSVRMQENTDQKNSEYGHFSRSEKIRRRLWIRSHLPKKLLAKNLFFCEMYTRGVAFIFCYLFINGDMLTRKLSLFTSILSSVIITNEFDFEKITDRNFPDTL